MILNEEYELARDAYEESLAKFETNIRLLQQYARMCTRKLKDFDKARELYERALVIEPHNVRGMFESLTFKNFTRFINQKLC